MKTAISAERIEPLRFAERDGHFNSAFLSRYFFFVLFCFVFDRFLIGY
jgi:hypothetical protein